MHKMTFYIMPTLTSSHAIPIEILSKIHKELLKTHEKPKETTAKALEIQTKIKKHTNQLKISMQGIGINKEH
jgi:hypothetical protein